MNPTQGPQGRLWGLIPVGLAWLRCLRRELSGQLHIWPFDGWVPSASPRNPRAMKGFVRVQAAVRPLGSIEHFRDR